MAEMDDYEDLAEGFSGLTAAERAEVILEATEDPKVRDELSRRHGFPLGLSKDEILDKLLVLYDLGLHAADGETQHG